MCIRDSRTVAAIRPGAEAEALARSNLRRLRDVGCLSMPMPVIGRQAWLRQPLGSRAWSICGVTHTLASESVMDGIAGLLTAPVKPWDALVCTSRGARDVVRRLLEHEADNLRAINGATRFSLPKLPVIPLGVDAAAHAFTDERRQAARRKLGIGPEETVVLFVGRLVWHAKANPCLLYTSPSPRDRTRSRMPSSA